MYWIRSEFCKWLNTITGFANHGYYCITGFSAGAQQSVRLFPAEVAVVYNLPDLQAAIADQKRDIEIRSHLDLRDLPLKSNPYKVYQADIWDEERMAGTDLAFLS